MPSIGDWVIEPGTEHLPDPVWVELVKVCLRCPNLIPRGRTLCDECRGIARIVRRLRRPPAGELRPLVFSRDKGRCALCRVDATETGWIVDHVVPLADGGHPRDPRNLRTLCRECEREVTRAWRSNRPHWKARELAREQPRRIGRRLPQGRPMDRTANAPEQDTDMKLNEAFPSKWLKAADVEDSPMVLTISSADLEQIKNDKGELEGKLVVRFREVEKGLICNITNANTISGHFGDDTDDWIGKKITLGAVEVQFGKEMVMGLRVSKKLPKAPQAAPARPKAAPAVAGVNADVSGDDDEDIPF